ncbi:MAG: FmdB family zinc ribbon protein [Actinomycetes bacterium]|jgi:putative FmdB family regulatory protein
MPTYQYACTACGHEFELFQAFSEDAISICPLCQGEVRKVYSNVGVVFKGSGFYKNDSRTSTTSTEKKSPAPAPTPAPKSDPAP